MIRTQYTTLHYIQEEEELHTYNTYNCNYNYKLRARA